VSGQANDETGNAGALDGIRVLDATQMLSGPICTMRLADLGADVLKIEPPNVGDWTRTHGFANAYINGETTAYLGLNRNKRSVTLNLKDPDGLAAFHDLVRTADVFIQNYRVGTAERIGAGYEALSAINPNLVYCSISGYGETGPHAGRPGQDLVIQGYSGSLFSVGSSEDRPTPGPLWAADTMTGYQAGMGILSALIARGRIGRGQKIEVSMLGVVMDCQAQELTTFLNLGSMPERTHAPSAHAWVTAPYGVYRTADGWMTIAQVALDVLGEALDDDRLRSMTNWDDGVIHRDEVYQIVDGIIPTRTTAEWQAIFDQHKLWCGPVYDYAGLEADPHVQATGMITSIEHPQHGTLRMPAPPLRMTETPPTVRTPPPTLGQHTDDVLTGELGYSPSKVRELHKSGAI
jgi:crotonobetainyl-CoA:carnitine CoA-transferase CaiB-like acyl-CoA transferase